MTIPPYSTSIKIPAGSTKDIYFDYHIFGGLPAKYIKLKSTQDITISFKVADRWITFPDTIPANVWVDIEEEMTVFTITNTSTTTTATVYMYATTYRSTKESPTYKTEVVPKTLEVM